MSKICKKCKGTYPSIIISYLEGDPYCYSCINDMVLKDEIPYPENYSHNDDLSNNKGAIHYFKPDDIDCHLDKQRLRRFLGHCLFPEEYFALKTKYPNSLNLGKDFYNDNGERLNPLYIPEYPFSFPSFLRYPVIIEKDTAGTEYTAYIYDIRVCTVKGNNYEEVIKGIEKEFENFYKDFISEGKKEFPMATEIKNIKLENNEEKEQLLYIINFDVPENISQTRKDYI